jgi:hypothetical protein
MKVVFQSESMRLHSYSLKGARAEAEFNWQLKNYSNAISALIENRLLTVGVFDCSATPRYLNAELNRIYCRS